MLSHATILGWLCQSKFSILFRGLKLHYYIASSAVCLLLNNKLYLITSLSCFAYAVCVYMYAVCMKYKHIAPFIEGNLIYELSNLLNKQLRCSRAQTCVLQPCAFAKVLAGNMLYNVSII